MLASDAYACSVPTWHYSHPCATVAYKCYSSADSSAQMKRWKLVSLKASSGMPGAISLTSTTPALRTVCSMCTGSSCKGERLISRLGVCVLDLTKVRHVAINGKALTPISNKLYRNCRIRTLRLGQAESTLTVIKGCTPLLTTCHEITLNTRLLHQASPNPYDLLACCLR